MRARLLACPSCARHVRVDEERCPFCGEACPESFASSPAPVPPLRGLSRTGLIRFGVLAAAGMVGGGMALANALSCSSRSVPVPVYGAAPCGPSTYACPDAEFEATGDDGGRTEAATMDAGVIDIPAYGGGPCFDNGPRDACLAPSLESGLDSEGDAPPDASPPGDAPDGKE